MMETMNTEINQAFAQAEWITVCWDPKCRMHRLDHWAAGRWVTHTRRDEYAKYTHGICKKHARAFKREVARFFAQRGKVVAA